MRGLLCILLHVCGLVFVISAEEHDPLAPVVLESGEELWYTPGYYNKDAPTEVLYLQAQCDVMWVREKKIFDSYLPKAAFETPKNPKDAIVIADIGCGPGATSAELLEAYPGVFVHCVDVQPYFVNHAHNRFASIVSSDRFDARVGTVLNSTLPSSHADIVLVRLTLQHIPKIHDAIAELYRVLKPGGRLIVIDTDESIGDLYVPRLQAIDELANIHGQMRSERAHPMLSLHLWDWLSDAGFAIQTFDACALHSAGSVNLRPFEVITSPSVFYSLSSKGLVPKSKVERAIVKWRAALKRTPLQMTVHFFYFIADKPSSQQAHQEL